MSEVNEINPIQQAEKNAIVTLDKECIDLEVFKAEAENMVIESVNDVKGYKAVDDARKKVKKIRTSIERERKELVSEANAFLSNVNGHAKALKESVQEVEQTLIDKLKVIDDEKARIAEEKRIEKEKMIDERIEALSQYNHFATRESLEALDNEGFSEYFENVKAEYLAEQARIQAKKEEAERIERMVDDRHNKVIEVNGFLSMADLRELSEEQFESKLEQFKEAKIQAEKEAEEKAKAEAEEKAKADAERLAREKAEAELAEMKRKEAERLEAERLEKERIAREEAEAKAEAERIEQERIEAERKAKEEAEAKAEAERKEKERLEYLESIKPDFEKIETFISHLETMEKPTLKDEILRDQFSSAFVNFELSLRAILDKK